MKERTRLTGTGSRLAHQAGRIGWILLWLIGVPLPVLFALFLLRGCT